MTGTAETVGAVDRLFRAVGAQFRTVENY